MTVNGYGSRKFLTSLVVLISASLLAWQGTITPEMWMAAAAASQGIYTLGNVGEHIANNRSK